MKDKYLYSMLPLSFPVSLRQERSVLHDLLPCSIRNAMFDLCRMKYKHFVGLRPWSQCMDVGLYTDERKKEKAFHLYRNYRLFSCLYQQQGIVGCVCV
jgi:hypothetical protein